MTERTSNSSTSTSSSASFSSHLIFSNVGAPSYEESVTLLSQQVSISCHKLLLAAASPFLCNLLKDQEPPLTIFLPDFAVDSLKLLPEFLLTGVACCHSKEQKTSCQELLSLLKLIPSDISYSIQENEFLYIGKENKLDTKCCLVEVKNYDVENRMHGVKASSGSKDSGKLLNACKERCLEEEKTTKQKYVCEVCGGNYKDSCTLKVHVETQHTMVIKPFECDICGDKFKTKGAMKIHSSKHVKEKAFICDQCGFQTKNKWLLKAHTKTHKSVKDFKCPHCPKTFNFQFILDKHIRIHTNDRPYPCETCGSSFVSGIHLRRHQKSVHKTVRDFVCNICSAPFKRLSELKRHIILHTGEKPFECTICGEMFKHREAGRRHSKSVHPDSISSITFKPTEAIGQLNSVAIKKLDKSIVSECYNIGSSNQN